MRGSRRDGKGGIPIEARSSSSRRVVVFIHIPKAAGSTMDEVLMASDPDGHRHAGNVFKGVGGVDVRRYGRAEEVVLDPTARVLAGHLPFGVAGFLPSSVEVDYVTILREPVERALSHYYWQLWRKERPKKRAAGPLRILRRDEENPDDARLPAHITPDTPLDQAFFDISYVPDNLQTRFLCGSPEPFGPVDDEMLEAAKKNLRSRFAVVGVAERMEESLLLLKRRLGFGAILYESARVNPVRPRSGDVPAEVRDAAERANEYDARLYLYAVERFDEAMTELGDLETAIDLAALRLAKEGAEIPPPHRDFDGGTSVWSMVVRARAEALQSARIAGAARQGLEIAVQEGGRWLSQLEARIDELEALDGGSDAMPPKRLRQLERERADARRMVNRIRQEEKKVRRVLERPEAGAQEVETVPATE